MTSIPYRKLPGHRRGLFRGASVWMGPDHLLAVRSARFREQYKRFYLRDVQALVVARRPRFHISTRAILLAILWLAASLYFRSGIDAYFVPAIGAVLVGVWIYVSGWCSCTCRIRTAVSRDELPSVYRTWTARKFLAVVGDRIIDVQGAIKGDWTGTVEANSGRDAALAVAPQPTPAVADHAPLAGVPQPVPLEVASGSAPPEIASESATIGPHSVTAVPESQTQSAVITSSPPAQPIAPQSVSFANAAAGPSTRPVLHCFSAILFVDAIVRLLSLETSAALVTWMLWAITLARMAMTIVIVIQYRRSRQSALMYKMAVVILIAGAGLYYVQQVVWGMSASAPLALGRMNLLIIRISRVANVILDIAGLFAISRAKRKV